ncbi:MAG: hypothetical protein ABFD50_20590 [Smithella sp.]
MPIVTPIEVTMLSNITCTAGTILAGGFIKEVTNNINLATNNYFVSDIYIQSGLTFNPDDLTITSDIDFEEYGFVSGDEIYIAGSYRNDGYKMVSTVSGKVLTLATGETIVRELSGRSIMISLVQFPASLKRVASQMIAYDYDKRNKQSSGLKSQSLGPWSESYANVDSKGDGNGYPSSIMDLLIPYRISRMI